MKSFQIYGGRWLAQRNQGFQSKRRITRVPKKIGGNLILSRMFFPPPVLLIFMKKFPPSLVYLLFKIRNIYSYILQRSKTANIYISIYISIAKNYDPDEFYSCQPRGCYRESFSMSAAAITLRPEHF